MMYDHQGTVSFAGGGPNSRSSHVFIALEPQGVNLGKALHERPFGQIRDPKHKEVFLNFFLACGAFVSDDVPMAPAAPPGRRRCPLRAGECNGSAAIALLPEFAFLSTGCGEHIVCVCACV
jgi:hypothetical protein